jgi:hypothetical protein
MLQCHLIARGRKYGEESRQIDVCTEKTPFSNEYLKINDKEFEFVVS